LILLAFTTVDILFMNWIYLCTWTYLLCVIELIYFWIWTYLLCPLELI